jgi:lipopolysaccharide transport system permease protein
MSAVAERAAAWRRSRTQVAGQEVNVIEPWRAGVFPRFEEVWRFKSLLPYLGKEFVLKRYRKTYLGPIWILLKPGIDILSRSVFFGGVLNVHSGNRPYFIFIAFASAGWMIFERAWHWGTRCVQFSTRTVSGLHFPRSMALLSTAIPTLVDFFLYALVAIVGTFYYLVVRHHYYLAPPQQMVIGVAGLVMLILFGLSLGLVTSPIAALTKESRYLVTYTNQILYFVTPIVYPISSIPAKYRMIAEYNPLTGPIEMVKFGFLSTAAPEAKSLLVSFAALGIVICGGLWISSRFERAAVARL